MRAIDQDPCTWSGVREVAFRVLVASAAPGEVYVRVEGDYHYMTPASARAIALSLLAAADKAEGRLDP